MKKILLIIVFLLFPSLAFSITSVTRNGVTFTWSQDKPSGQWGQYANGDYWVLIGSGFTLTAMTPSASGGRNGYEVNPNSHWSHPYDSRATNGYDTSLMPSLPLNITTDSSIVKTISTTQDTTYEKSVVQTAVILTVLTSAPPDGTGADCFRPNYFGTGTRTHYRVSSMVSNMGILPTKTLVANAPTLATVEANFSGQRLEHNAAWYSRFIRPRDGSNDYPAVIARTSAEAVLRLESEGTIAQKTRAAMLVTQAGLDIYGLRLSGQTWPSDGGNMHGYKFLIWWAGMILNDTAIKSAVSNAPENTYAEDGSVWHSNVENNGSGADLWGKYPDGMATETEYWLEQTVANSGSKMQRDPYGYIDGKGTESVCETNYYQSITFGGFVSESIAVRIMGAGAVAVWNSPRFHGYADRMMTDGGKTQPDPCAPIPAGATQASASYRVSWGPDPAHPGDCIRDTNPADGTGRFPTQNGNKNGGTYWSAYGESMYTAYVNQGIDLAPPVASNIVAVPGQTTATVTAITDEGATSLLQYGPTTAYGSQSALNANYLTTHSISLYGLTNNTLYHYRIIFIDAAGNPTTTTDRTFTTQVGGDTQNPVINSLTMSSTSNSLDVPISIVASDNVGVTGYCTVLVNSYGGCNWSAINPTSYHFPFAGVNPLYVFVQDAAGNKSLVATKTVTITLPSVPSWGNVLIGF